MSMYLLSKWMVVINPQIIRKLEVNESETYNIKPNIKDYGKSSTCANVERIWKQNNMLNVTENYIINREQLKGK